MLRVRVRPRIGHRARVRISLLKLRVAAKEKATGSPSRRIQRISPQAVSSAKSRGRADFGTRVGSRAVEKMDAFEVSLAEIQQHLKNLTSIKEDDLEDSSSSSSSSSSSGSSASGSSSGEDMDAPVAREGVSGRVTVCQGKDCRKQGATKVLNSVESFLRSTPEMQNVSVKTCKCLDLCGKGPSISTKFGQAKGQKHKRVKPKSIPAILTRAMKQSTS